MKKFSNISRFTTFALAATLCMPAHAMWLRQAGQKMVAVATAVARQARTGATTLAQTSKNLQRTLTLGRAAQTAARAETATPAVRPLPHHWQTITAQKIALEATAQENASYKAWQTLKKIIGGATALSTGYAAVPAINSIARPLAETASESHTFDIDDINETINHTTPWQLQETIKKHKNNPVTWKQLTSFATKNIALLHPKLIITLLEEDPSLIDAFRQAALANCIETPSRTLEKLRHNSSFANDLRIKLKASLTEEVHRQDALLFWDKVCFYKRFFDRSFTPTVTDVTATEQHLFANNALAFNEPVFIFNRCTRAMVNDAIAKERSLQKQGYFTCYHAQRSKYLLPEELFAELTSVHTNKEIKDFVFAHARPRHDEATEQKIYEEIKKYGRRSKDDPNRHRMLFLNFTFFGNTRNDGSCSASYYISNKNNRNRELTFQEVCAFFGDEDIYKKYEHELIALHNEHTLLCNDHGTMLLFGVPQKVVEKNLYLANGGTLGGSKKTISLKGAQTDNLMEIQEAMRSHPHDLHDFNRIEITMIMVGECMDPTSGIKVFAFNDIPLDKKKTFEQKKNDLFARIREDVRIKVGRQSINNGKV